MTLRNALSLLLLLSGCAVSGSESNATELARQAFLEKARAATFRCPLAEVRFERDPSEGQPFRVELFCQQGTRETFLLRRTVAGRPAASRFFEVISQDEAARQDQPTIEALLRDTFVRDPWQERGGTFGTRNAVGRGSEVVILIILLATFLGGLSYVVRARPESPS